MFPQYLFYGMTYEQYWEGNPSLVCAYREAHKLRMEARNQELWYQGAYNYSAIMTALSNIHLDGKSHKMNPYMDKPFDIFGEEHSRKEKIREVEKARQKVIDKFTALKLAWDRKEKKNVGCN